MEDLWKRAKCFAEEAAKKSQSLTNPSKIADLVSETTRKSKEFAAEASKKADQFKIAALKQADQIKSFSDIIPPNLSSIATSSSSPSIPYSPSELEKFGVTDDLRDFVKGLTTSTFQNFPLKPDEVEASDVPTLASNVRKDLNEFQEKHANIVLTTVKEISRLRYELCPRVMKERYFWKIYFTLVNSHVAPLFCNILKLASSNNNEPTSSYEKQYLEDVQLKEATEQEVDSKVEQTAVTGKDEAIGKNVEIKSSKSSSTEQDLDTFLLGDLEESDEGPDDAEGSFDDDFDKIGNSDVEEEKHANRTSTATV
ncbi:BSD domain-containing protein [Senna tora]|uniref:BSD domain-containing protein n=1 Tax=Senna tora TaxID=362788 RepID=A0A834TTS2_9FABA|nr:BSD domain-containing protein [Senna tora]